MTLFAETVREGTGSDALLVRLGGEAFAALLPGCDRQPALGRGAAIARRFAAAATGADGLAIHATVSGGLAAPEGRDLAERLASADGALYRAKVLGGNRIEAAGPEALAAAA